MSVNPSPESPKYRIEFTGNSAPKKKRKPPPKWMVNWFGGLLLFIAGTAIGGCAAIVLLWTILSTTDDMGGFLGALMFLIFESLVKIIGPVAGSIVGLLIWAKLRSIARKLEEIE